MRSTARPAAGAAAVLKRSTYSDRCHQTAWVVCAVRSPAWFSDVEGATMKGEELIRVQVRYRGRVQGVGFRATARSVARAEPAVTGWVRNEADGTVLLEAQGPHRAVRAVLRRLRGEMARGIESAEETVSPVVEGERGFVVAR